MAKLLDKSQLADQAAELFRMKGYSATSIDDIARACGITKGSIYHHFASKEELALATLDDVHDYFRENIFSLIAARKTVSAADLQAFNQAIEKFFAEHRYGCLLANLSMDIGATCDPFKDKIRRFFNDWTACYAKAFSVGRDGREAKALAEDAIAIVQGCILMNRIRGSLEPLRRQHARLLQLCAGNGTGAQ